MSGSMDINRSHHMKRAIAMLSEHFDSVQVFGCYHDQEIGVHLKCTESSGNPWALRGLIREWLIMDDEETKAHALEVRRLRNSPEEE